MITKVPRASSHEINRKLPADAASFASETYLQYLDLDEAAFLQIMITRLQSLAFSQNIDELRTFRSCLNFLHMQVHEF
jgi:hypothetical protein